MFKFLFIFAWSFSAVALVGDPVANFEVPESSCVIRSNRKVICLANRVGQKHLLIPAHCKSEISYMNMDMKCGNEGVFRMFNPTIVVHDSYNEKCFQQDPSLCAANDIALLSFQRQEYFRNSEESLQEKITPIEDNIENALHYLSQGQCYIIARKGTFSNRSTQLHGYVAPTEVFDITDDMLILKSSKLQSQKGDSGGALYCVSEDIEAIVGIISFQAKISGSGENVIGISLLSSKNNLDWLLAFNDGY